MDDDQHFITTARWVSACPITSLEQREPFLLEVDEDNQIAVIKVNEDYYAIRNSCPHTGGPLHMGDIEDFPTPCNEEGEEKPAIVCPWHAWTFFLHNGLQVDVPQEEGGEKIETFETKLKDGHIMVKVTTKKAVDF
ncbi:Rieske (2Fe-2S) domain-containing protein [Planoprotostelium fungivorum]|uniref:Rieske (2Fe-2S) domain-containing protein n=1 Tax=Planoprotostelium fungivorum TaxID=1890364 RepID=A0A2P6NPP8_9EUKA|nr:Rieske (2Fe-2S) domain-containing protein [Planoprotostelium fungivorum]